MGSPQLTQMLFMQVYTESKGMIRNSLAHMMLGLPMYTDLEWRLDVQVGVGVILTKGEDMKTNETSLVSSRLPLSEGGLEVSAQSHRAFCRVTAHYIGYDYTYLYLYIVCICMYDYIQCRKELYYIPRC